MSNETERELLKLLFSVGINGSHRGYRYVKMAVRIKLRNQLMKAVDIYKIIGEKYHAKPETVCHSMAGSITYADNYGHLAHLNDLFGATVIHGKMTNASFLSKAAEYLRYFKNCT